MSFNPFSAIAEGVFGIVGKLVKDKDLAQRLNHELGMVVHQETMAQLAVNEKEAQHKSIFVAGWRPFTGWVCGVTLLYATMLQSIIKTVIALAVPDFDMSLLPTISMTETMPVLLGMLGLGSMRTVEKTKGVQRNN